MRSDQYVVIVVLGIVALVFVTWWIQITLEGRERLRQMEQARELNSAWAAAFGKWLEGNDRR